jgi:hypothetical protein
MSPWLALLLSFGYVFLMLGLGEGMRRWRNFSPDFTRKFIHISVGMYSILAVLWLCLYLTVGNGPLSRRQRSSSSISWIGSTAWSRR